MTTPILLEIVDQLGSTSESLKHRAAAGAAPVALMARQQTTGHGRFRRPWRSPPGNLYLSVLLRPSAPLQPGHWSLLAGVALATCLAATAPDIRLKWPNDVLLGGGKLAGILVEADGAAPWLVLGFGVNLRSAPADLGRPTTCLADHTDPPPPEHLARTLLDQLDRWRHRYAMDGFPPILEAWRRFGPAPDDPVTVSTPDGPLRGRFAGIGPEGALLLQDGPEHRRILSGEVE